MEVKVTELLREVADNMSNTPDIGTLGALSEALCDLNLDEGGSYPCGNNGEDARCRDTDHCYLAGHLLNQSSFRTVITLANIRQQVKDYNIVIVDDRE